VILMNNDAIRIRRIDGKRRVCHYRCKSLDVARERRDRAFSRMGAQKNGGAL